MKSSPSTGSGRTTTLAAAVLFGGLFAGAFFIGFGPDRRVPVVWNGQTTANEESVVDCLRRQSTFNTIDYISASAYGADAETRAYYLGKDVSLHFGNSFENRSAW